MQTNEPSTTRPPDDSLGELDMRIRSLSSLLRWVCWQQEAPSIPRRRDEGLAQFLDRVALMFVSGRRGSDSAAVIPTFDPAVGYGLTAIAMGSNVGEADARDDQCDIYSLLELLKADEVNFLVKRGHDPISLDLHAKHLEYLINRTYVGKEKPTQADLNRLERYLLIYGAQKLHDRLFTQWPGNRRRFKFLNLFLKTQSPKELAIPWERCRQLQTIAEIPDEFPEVKLQRKTEKWLYDLLVKSESRIQLESGEDPNLVLTPESVSRIYQLVSSHLGNIRRVLQIIRPLLSAPSQSRDISEKKIKAVNTSMASMSNSLIIIDRLVSTSRSFWRAMYTLLPSFEQLTLLPSVAPDILPGPPPESTLANTLGEPSEHDDGDGYEDKAEERGDDFALETSRHPIYKLRRWFILLTQWTRIVRDLEVFLPRVSRDPQKPLRIRARYADRAVDPHRQLSLFDTIKSVLPNSPLSDKIVVIKQAISNKTGVSRSLEVLRTMTEALDPPEWQAAFEGGIHCEAQLAQDYGEQIPFQTIGTSKRCCLCCEALLAAYGLRTTTHGKIYPWAPPASLSHEIQTYMITVMEAQLERFFKLSTPREHTPESVPDTSRDETGRDCTTEDDELVVMTWGN